MPTDDEREAIERALASIRAVARGERQRLEIVTLLRSGELGRARGLGAEHLAEFPHDALIRYLLDVHRASTSSETDGAD
jgi:hypothetical protein